MSMVYRYNSYSDWIATKQETRSQKRSVAMANSGLYTGWTGIALCRAGAFVEAITAFFRAHASFSLTAPVVLTGIRQTCSHVGLALSSAVSVAEMAVTSVIFGRDAHHYRCLGNHIDAHRINHQAYTRHIEDHKRAARYAKQANGEALEGTLPDEAPPLQSPHVDVGERLSCSAPAKTTTDMAVLAKSFFEYETAQVEYPEATTTFKRSLVMFLRDGPLQGGAVGCNLALLWQGCKVSDLLHIVTTPINAVGTAIGGAVFSAACGIFHIIGGALARSEGLQKLAAATGVKEKIDNAVRNLANAKAALNAEAEEAAVVGATLLQYAASNETKAEDDARGQVFVGNWRIGYGTTGIVIAAISLTLFLIVGGVSTGGLIFAAGGALILSGWVGYAAYRNGKDGLKLKTATDAGKPPAMTLEQAIARAVDYLDRTAGIGKDNRDARRLIKYALVDIGMRKADFRPLRFCSVEPGIKGPVIDALKVLIHNHVDGDGARRALEQGPTGENARKQKATA